MIGWPETISRIELYGYTRVRETIGYTMKTKYRKTLQIYIKIAIIKYIIYVLHKIKDSQNTLDRNTPH